MSMIHKALQNISFASVDTQVRHESLQPDMDDLTQNIIDHSTCSVASQVCVPQESTMEPYTVPPESASLADEDIFSDGDEDNRIKLTHLNLIIEHLNVLTMAKYYVMVMLNYCVPNAQDFTCALFVILVTFTKIMNDF